MPRQVNSLKTVVHFLLKQRQRDYRENRAGQTGGVLGFWGFGLYTFELLGLALGLCQGLWLLSCQGILRCYAAGPF